MADTITERACRLAALPVFAGCRAADLYPLAAVLHPLRATSGETLMHQGQRADFFLIIEAGEARVHHEDPDGDTTDIEVPVGSVIGEIALLRHTARVATVTATAELSGFVGDGVAFDVMIELPGVLEKLLNTARQRLAAFLTPVRIRLHDGTELFLRPVLPGDNARAVSGRVEFSDETLFRRFMTTRDPTGALMEYLFEVDYIDHFVWVVLDAQDGNLIADARFVRDEIDRHIAEIAFIVGDDYQGRGVGSFLMKALAVAARVAGVEKFTARVLSDNLPMRTILDRFGASWEREDVGVVTTVIEVPDLNSIHLPEELIDQIADVARQAMRSMS